MASALPAQNRPREKPKQALIAMAVKWLHTAYAMLKHRVPYDPSRLVALPATIST